VITSVPGRSQIAFGVAIRLGSMLLIFGTKARYVPMEAGTFYCPDEGGDRGYTLLEARRWFTLFFIPLIKLGLLGYVVECDSCRRQYDQRTLHLPTSASMEHKIEVAARALFGSLADSHPHPGRVAAELESFLGCPAYCATDLVAHSRIQTPAQRHEALVAAGDVLDPAGREGLLLSAASAAVSDGEITAKHRSILLEAGSSLGMTPIHVEGVMTVAVKPSVTEDH
jgi:hypothetical protein